MGRGHERAILATCPWCYQVCCRKGWGEKGGRNEDKDGVKLFHAYTGNIRTCLVVNEEFFCEIAKKLHAEHNAIMEKLADMVRKKKLAKAAAK